ncbi:MAG TPA: carboxypeptidase-like regulatory domain-containing protein, partial [Planctomycetia bacterium]|nr:carboxypeptidase-like regulatory domain-containing protein [Planctomycetia bacterium]
MLTPEELAAKSPEPFDVDVQFHRLQGGGDPPGWKSLSYQRKVRIAMASEAAKAGASGALEEWTLAVKRTFADVPPGTYQIYRYGPDHRMLDNRVDVALRSGAESTLEYRRTTGARIEGAATLPENTVFARQVDAPPPDAVDGRVRKPLTWDLAQTAFVVIKSADGAAREAARIVGGRFVVPLRLAPGKYVASASAFLPEDDQSRRFSGLIAPDLNAQTEFTIPDDPQKNVVQVNLKMIGAGLGGRLQLVAPKAPAAAAERGKVRLRGTVALPTDTRFTRKIGPPEKAGGPFRTNVEMLDWKHVENCFVNVKLNDRRASIKVENGAFDSAVDLPPGRYQGDCEAWLKLDDDVAARLNEPPADLDAGTLLFDIPKDAADPIKLEFKLHPAPFNRRLAPVDAAKAFPRLEGKITGPDGAPLKDVRIALYAGFATRWRIAETSTDSGGAFSFPNLRSSMIKNEKENRWDSYVGVQFEHPTMVPADGISWRDVTVSG